MGLREVCLMSSPCCAFILTVAPRIARVKVFGITTSRGWLMSAYAADGSFPSVEERVQQVAAERNVLTKLTGLARIGAGPTASEVPSALIVASKLKELRECAVLEESALKRWSETAPEAAYRTADLPGSTPEVS